jgi:hypothetical protein
MQSSVSMARFLAAQGELSSARPWQLLAWGIVWLTLLFAMLWWFAPTPFVGVVEAILGSLVFIDWALTALLFHALNKGSPLKGIDAAALSIAVSVAIWTLPALMLAGLGDAMMGISSALLAAGASLGAGPAILARLAGKSYWAALGDFLVAGFAVTGSLALVFTLVISAFAAVM